MAREAPEEKRIRKPRERMRGWWWPLILLGFVVLAQASAVLYGAALLVLYEVWPAEAFAECVGDAACVLGVSFTDGLPLWIGLVWAYVIGMIVVAGFRVERPKGSPSLVYKRLLSRRHDKKQQRIGQVTGLVLVGSLFAALATLLLVPATVGLVAALAWPKDRVQACGDERGCLISFLPDNALPVWIAFVWVAIIAVAMVVCWPQERWWEPDRTKPYTGKVYNFTSPMFIGIHAALAAFFCFRIGFGVQVRGVDVPVLEYWWPSFAGWTIAAICFYRHRKLTKTPSYGLRSDVALVISSWLRMLTPSWHVRRRELQRRRAERATKQAQAETVSAGTSPNEGLK